MSKNVQKVLWQQFRITTLLKGIFVKSREEEGEK
jgi:hypothetical protein